MSKAKIAIAKALRKNETKAESLLWELLRGKQLCGLKFRRQHPIDPYFADFACVSKKIVIELDGGYHDHTVEQDLKRQKYLEEQGWKVLRFSNEDVLEDAEAVTRAIAAELGLTYEFVQRPKARSGMMNRKSHPLAFLATFPGGKVSSCVFSINQTNNFPSPRLELDSPRGELVRTHYASSSKTAPSLREGRASSEGGQVNIT